MNGVLVMTILHGGDLKKYQEKYKLAEQDLIDFSANINPLGTPAVVYRALLNRMAQIKNYPQPLSRDLKRIIAAKLGMAETNIVIGNGAVDLIYQLVQTQKPEEVLLFAPTFSEYHSAVTGNGGVSQWIELDRADNFTYHIEHILAKLAQIKMIFLCNPNNPTGSLLQRRDLEKVCLACQEQDILLVIDESFIDFLADLDQYTVIDLAAVYPKLFVLRSLTKFYAIPGLRLGYGVGEADLIKSIEENGDPWRVNMLAQLAGEVIFEREQCQQYTELTFDVISREREFLYRELQKIKGFKPLKSPVNFILVNIAETGFNSTEITDQLGSKGIIVRDCGSFRGLKQDYIRVAVKTRRENLILIKHLLTLFKKGENNGKI